MSVPVTDFMKKSIDMGGLAQTGAALRSAIDNAGISLQGDVGAAGITSQADVEAAKLVGAAQKAVASAEQNAAMMGMLGKIGGGLMTGLGNMGGGAGDLGLPGLSPTAYNDMTTPDIGSFGGWGGAGNFQAGGGFG